jgi:hypothetical protein
MHPGNARATVDPVADGRNALRPTELARWQRRHDARALRGKAALP